ncbi:Uncharacterised protein [[Flavobacterium] thermophilum]|nr:Uncharacterised protein [[Flavobacterium] thermophilum]
MKINLEVGQKWVSDTHPHEDFEIYEIIHYPDEEYPTEIYYCWKRINEKAFDEFIKQKKGKYPDELIEAGKNTYPYAWCGEAQKSNIINKIKKYNMKLSE